MGKILAYAVLGIVSAACTLGVWILLNGGQLQDDWVVRFGPSDTVQRDGPPLAVREILCRYAWNSNFSPYACREYTDDKSYVFVTDIRVRCPLTVDHVFGVRNCTAEYSTDFYDLDVASILCALTIRRLTNHILYETYPDVVMALIMVVAVFLCVGVPLACVTVCMDVSFAVGLAYGKRIAAEYERRSDEVCEIV
jgi:hypothetical protein